MLSNYFRLKVHREGSALVFILILLLIFSLVAASISYVFSSNLKMAKRQEDSVRTHYLALSGIDLTIATLISRVEVSADGSEKKMYQKIVDGGIDQQLTDSIEIDGVDVDIILDYKKDKKEFTITSSVDEGNGIKTLSLNITFSGSSYKTHWK